MRWQRCLVTGLTLSLGVSPVVWGGEPAAVIDAGAAPGLTAPAGPSSGSLARPGSLPAAPVTGPAGVAQIQAQTPAPATTPTPAPGDATTTGPGTEPGTPEPPTPATQQSTGAETEQETYGPTPLLKVNCLNNWLYGDQADKACVKLNGWMDFDYTYSSNGHGENNIAPVMNRFGDEFLTRQLGIYAHKDLDPKELSWGFNCIFIAGADAAFLTPTAGGWRNTDPRFGTSFTDLNLTAHLPILTEGGVDIKAGRQTTILGPMGALPWQRWFDSSDYAWYNMEEGRYTGVSSVWHVSKRLDWYNGIEFGWGTFFDVIGPAPQYITNMSYWLDEKMQKAKVWFTVLTGPTGEEKTGNTTVLELGTQINWNKYWYQIIDSQMVWSKAPIFGFPPPNYTENAYDVYTYLGYHVNKCLDLQSRFEWYNDINGGGYPGGFGIPHNDYYEMTYGFDYHPVKWLQIRPEIRYDWATRPAFGPQYNHKDELTLACDALIKF